MASSILTKTKASTLAKVAALPVFRHPADLLNEYTLPYDLQIKQLEGEAPFEGGQYVSQNHFNLAKLVAGVRKQYRLKSDEKSRDELANQQYQAWNSYLTESVNLPEIKLNQKQKKQIYQAMLTAKQRNEQRLALSRFIKFGYEYSQAFKVDLPLNPVIIMKMVHPYFGYLNLIPNQSQYKYTHEQLFTLIQQFSVASMIRETGCTLHSTEMVSFIFWKILSGTQGRVSFSKFLQILKVFKFRNLTEQNPFNTFRYSLKMGELLPEQKLLRFDVLRQISIDHNL